MPEKPHRDPHVLKKLYHEQGLTGKEVGDVIGCSGSTVLRWMRKHDIDRRQRMVKPRTGDQGYVVLQTVVDGKSVNVYMHRLLAVAEHGFDAVKENVVHHKNGIRWDNRPTNIQITTQANHIKTHAKNEESGNILTEQNVREIRDRYPDDCTLTELAEKFGVSLSTAYDAYNRNTFKWIRENE